MTATRHRGVLAAALVFFLAVSIGNAVRGDWLSVALGAVVAGACARRWRQLRPQHRPPEQI